MKTVIALLLTLLASATHAAEVQSMVGYAYDLRSDQLLYVERHQSWFDQGQLRFHQVDYELPDGASFANKTSRYDGDPLRPQFALTDQRTGYVEALERRDGKFVVAARKGSAREFRERALAEENFIADAGFNGLIEQNWAALLAGERFDLPFLVPVLLKPVSFVLIKHRQDAHTVTFRMSARSFWARLLVDPIDVTYDTEQRQLRRYVGMSNVRDQRLKNFRVRIEFPPAEYSVQSRPELAEVTVPTLAQLRRPTAL